MPLKIFRQVLRTEQTKTLLHSEIYRFIFDVHVTEKNIATKNLLQTAKLSFINFVILYSSNNCYIVFNKKNIKKCMVIKTLWINTLSKQYGHRKKNNGLMPFL